MTGNDQISFLKKALLIFSKSLFRPSHSDDASHDEALSSRIAALNMLDLTLDHLGVDSGKSTDDVIRIVEACGESKFYR